MRCKSLTVLALCLVMLSGCKSEEVVEEVIVEEIPLTQQADFSTFDGITINAVGPWCGFINTDTYVQIHPFYNSTQHIKVEKILLSDKPYWETIKSQEGVITNISNDIEMMTLTDGRSFAYMEDNDGYAYMFSTDSLPSSYLDIVLRKVSVNASE